MAPWVIMLVCTLRTSEVWQPAGAAGFVGDAQVAGVHEADVVPIFFEPVGVGADGIGGVGFVRENSWLGMGLVFCGVVFVGVWVAVVERMSGLPP